MKIDIEKAREKAKKKWGVNYNKTKYVFDKANENEDYMDAIKSFLKNDDISYVVFIQLANVD